MQEWNRWFTEQQEALGTVEDFARKSGIGVRSISAYRNTRMPRGRSLAKIAAVLGSEGPVPGPPSKRIATLEERVARLEEVVFSREGDAEIRELRARLGRVLREGAGPPEAEAGQSPA